jgi:hypothetical protein
MQGRCQSRQSQALLNKRLGIIKLYRPVRERGLRSRHWLLVVLNRRWLISATPGRPLSASRSPSYIQDMRTPRADRVHREKPNSSQRCRGRREEKSDGPELVFVWGIVDAHFCEAVTQGVAREPEGAGGLAFVAVGAFQGFAEELFFELLESHALWQRC